MKSNQKGFASIAIVLIVAAVLVVGGAAAWYYSKTAKPKPVPMVIQQPVQLNPVNQTNSNVSQTQEPAVAVTQGIISSSQVTNQQGADSTSSWQIYRNEKCGYEIKYPAEYNPVENGDGVSFLNVDAMKCYKLGKQAGKDCIDSGSSAYINCSLSKDFLNGASSIGDYIAQGIKSASFSPNFAQKTVNVGNLSGIEAEGLGYAGAYKDIYLQKGDHIIQFEVQKEGNGAGVEIFDKMISTFNFTGQPSPFETRELDSKEYRLAYNGEDLFTGNGPIMVKEILNCTVPDLSTKCPETSFIGEENCKNITHAPAECAYDGELTKDSTPSCIYEDFGGVAMGTIVTGYYGLVIRNGKCFLISWSLMHYNCDNYMPSPGESSIPYQKCIAGDSQRKMNNEQMISTFKITDQTTGWKTYQDAGLGFEFQYPSEATLTKSSVPYLNLYLENIPVASNSNELHFRALMVSVQNDCPPFTGPSEFYAINDIKFTERREGEGGNQSSGYYYNYFTVKNNKCFILSFALSGSKTNTIPKEEPIIFRQIVSTFKFID